MKSILFIISLTFTQLIFSNNWDVIEMHKKYNYSINNDFITTTIWVDSTYLNQGDSVFVLNEVSNLCSTCPNKYFSSKVYLKNQPSFLQRYIRKTNSGIINFTDTGNYSINTNLALGDSSLFNSLNNTYLTYRSKNYLEVFENTFDSVKLYTTSFNDTIIISKSFGITKFPNFKGSHYALVGVEGITVTGKSNLYFDDFFNFQVGDIFQYVENSGYRFKGPEVRQKHKVISIQRSSDSIIVNTEMKERTLDYRFNIPSDTFYSSSLSSIVYLKSEYGFLNDFNYLNVEDSVPTLYGYDSTLKSNTKTWNREGIVAKNDTLYMTGNPSVLNDKKQYIFGEDIGLIRYYRSWNFSGQYANYYDKKLEGYIIGSDTAGLVYDDNYFQPTTGISTNTNNVLDIEIKLVNNDIVLTNNDIFQNLEASIFNAEGKKIIFKKLSSTSSNTINISDLSIGIYIVKVMDNSGKVVVQKVIKQN